MSVKWYGTFPAVKFEQIAKFIAPLTAMSDHYRLAGRIAANEKMSVLMDNRNRKIVTIFWYGYAWSNANIRGAHSPVSATSNHVVKLKVGMVYAVSPMDAFYAG